MIRHRKTPFVETTSLVATILPALLRKARRLWLTPIVASVLVVVLIAGAVIVGPVTRRQIAFDDGTVWISSAKDHRIARFNVRVSQIDAVVAATATNFDVLQQGSTTLLDERVQVTDIDAATVTPLGEIRTGTQLSVMLGGETAAFFDARTGDVWVRTASDLASSSLSGKPQMTVGPAGKVAVDHTGTVYGLRASDGAVFALEPGDDQPREKETIDHIEQGRIGPFTVVDGIPVALSGSRLCWPNGVVNLPDSGTLMLQRPPADDAQSGWVAAVGDTGLFLVDLDQDNNAAIATKTDKTENGVTSFHNTGSGEPTEPVSVNGCVHAAWNQSTDNYLRVCSPEDDAGFTTLQGVSATSALTFRTNHRLVVLNDVNVGNVWNPQDSTDVIQVEWNTTATKTDDQTSLQESGWSSEYTHGLSATCSPDSGSILAENDTFAARPGSRIILDVLRNDKQTDCSVLHISSVTVPDDAINVTPVYGGRYLQLDASTTQPGTFSFSYEIDDGRGQTASADVTLIISDDGNHAPAQVDPPSTIDIEQGAVLSTNALATFADADGDPMTLVSATVTNTDQVSVSARSDGRLDVDAGTMPDGRISVEFTVSDGRDIGTGTMYFTVHPANTLPATIEPVAVEVLTDTPTTIDLAPYVHGSSSSLPQLANVTGTEDAIDVTTDSDSLSLTVEAHESGTLYVPYTVVQGTVESTGLLRVEASVAAFDDELPITATDVAVLHSDGTAIIDPLSNDIDPMGGVLAVAAVSTDSDDALTTTVVDGSRVYLSTRKQLLEPAQITYTAVNAVGSSSGSIVVQPSVTDPSSNVLRAADISVSVRTGGIVSIDVMDHVATSNTSTVSLTEQLQYDDALGGLLFTSGNRVRYQAGDAAGTFNAVYTVQDANGTTSSGTITIDVHHRDSDNKPDPVPEDIVAQVASGQQVRIPITLAGIDADGDDVTLLGLGNTAPSLGRIVDTGADYMLYEAYPDSQGTDTFSYAVEDWTGRRAQAQIRVGIFQGDASIGVLARDDTITLRTNTTATVDVVENDIGHGTLTLRDTVETQGIDASSVSARGNVIDFTTPNQAGTCYIVYTVEDETGLHDTAMLTVTVDPQAPIMPPVTHDYRVSPDATIDKRALDVDITPWISNPSGTLDDLAIGIDPSANESAWITRDQDSDSDLIHIELTDEAQAVPYTVTNTVHGLVSTAFIHVPAYGVFPPTLRPNSPSIEVEAGSTVTIDIADHVRVGAGKAVYVDSVDTVSATKAANADLYVNNKTLRFTAPTDYSGPASITFTAVDGNRNDNTRIINSSVITLPITVVTDGTATPLFPSRSIDVPAGETTHIDLTTLTRTVDGSSTVNSDISYSGGITNDSLEATVSQSGILTIVTSPQARDGLTIGIPITLTNEHGIISAGITAHIVASSRPLARIRDHTVTIAAGESLTIDVFADAYNPFPDSNLAVVSCSTASKEIRAECSADGNLTITVETDARSASAVSVTIRDATQSRDREITGVIGVTVMNRPSAPLLLPADAADGAVVLSWTPGMTNGSPITEFRVDWDGGTQSCGNATTCRITGLTNGQSYAFTVRAKNDVGWSDASNTVTSMPDRMPSAPTNIRIQGGYRSATVRWDTPDYIGSAPDGYTATLTGSNGWTTDHYVTTTSTTFSVPAEVIEDGVTFSAQVTAHNRAGTGKPSPSSAPAVIWADPQQPKVALTQDDDHIRLDVTLDQGRNAGCTRIEVSGSAKDTLECAASVQATYRIDPSQYWQDFKVTVTVVPEQQGATSAAATASIIPIRDIAAPHDVSVNGMGETCTVRWRGVGDYDGFHVSLDGFAPRTVDAKTTSTAFQLSPWQRCGSAKVSQTLLGRTGPTASADGNYVNAVAAKLDGMWVEWSDTDTVQIRGYDFNTWEQPASFTLTVDGVAHTVIRGQTFVKVTLPPSSEISDRHAQLTTVQDINPADNTEFSEYHTWTFTVTGENDSRLDNAISGVIANKRPVLGKASPVAFSMPQFADSTSTPTPVFPQLQQQGTLS